MEKFMLCVQEFLLTKNLEDLKNELGIEYNQSDDLVILNYSQIDSPKRHPIVMECRGLVLEIGTWRIIARSFNRFFNWSE